VPQKLLIYLFILSFCKCGTEPVSDKKAIVTKEKSDLEIPELEINYHLIPIDSNSIAWLSSIKSDDSLKLIYYLNRIDKRYLLTQDSVLLPDTFINDILQYAPFPQSVTALTDIHKIIFFSYLAQSFAVYEQGKLIRWGPVSMGKFDSRTPLGLFNTNWRSKRAISTVNKDWIMNWFYNLENIGGASMHEYDLPGFPASHACVRLLQTDAFWFYNWADSWIPIDSTKIAAQGTPVIIYGSYPFGKRRPWRALAEGNRSTIITEKGITQEVQNFLPLILKQKLERDSVILKKAVQ